MSKKILLVVCLVLLFSIFAGCSAAEPIETDVEMPYVDSSNDQKSAATESVDDANTENEPLKLTYWVPFAPGPSSLIKDNLGESMAYIEVEKRLNIDLEFLHPARGQETEQLNLMIASRELPDIIESFSYNKGLDQAIEDGLILKLNELIEEYGPDYKKIRETNDEIARQTITDEGNIAAMYCLQIKEDSGPAWCGLSIRGDLLEKLGLEKPETVDEWETALRGFKELGVDAPISFNFGGSFNNVGHFVSAYNAGPNFYQIDENGKKVVKYGPYEPQYKDFLTLLNRWYIEGLLDHEAFSRDSESFNSMVLQGEIAALVNGYGPTLSYNLYAAQNGDEEFNLIPVLNPSLKKGEQVHYRNNEIYNKGCPAVISTNCEQPEEAMKFLNYGFTEEGFMLYNYGVEGVSYEMIDGEPQWTELITNDPEGRNWPDIRDKYKRHIGPYWRDWAAFPCTDFELECMEEWTKPLNDFNLPYISRSAEENVRYGELMADIQTYVDEMRVKFVIGSESLDGYDNFRNRLKNMGMDEVLEIQQSALDRYYSR